MEEKYATRFYWLDLLRFAAALIVVFGHTRGVTFVEFGALPSQQKSLLIAAIFACTRIGNEAVVIFFVLSGFLVGGRAIERIANHSFRPIDYAIDRFTRIILPLFPALVLTAITGKIMGESFNLWHFIGNLFSLQGIFSPNFGGNSPLWSLAYEVWLYIFVWIVGIIILDRRLHLLSISLFVLIFTMFIHLSSVYIFCWFIGAIGYIRRPEKTSIIFLIGSAIVCLLAIIAVQIGTDSQSLQVESLRNFLPSVDVSRLLLAGGTTLLIQQLILIKPKTYLSIKLESAGTTLAAFSYTLYLTHYPILHAISFLGLPRFSKIDIVAVVTYGLVVLLCLMFAFTLYCMFEKRTPELRKWLKLRIIGRHEANLLLRRVAF